MIQLVIQAARSGDHPRWPVLTWAALCPRGPQAGPFEGKPLWTCPTTFLLDHPKGFFVNHVILRLQRAYVDGQLKFEGLVPTGRSRAGGKVDDVMNEPHTPARAGGSLYPAGPKVTEAEFKEAKRMAAVDP